MNSEQLEILLKEGYYTLPEGVNLQPYVELQHLGLISYESEWHRTAAGDALVALILKFADDYLNGV